jgi:TatD DNase family protein
VRLIDTHAHLDSTQFDPDREEVIHRALGAGIQIITMGTDLDSSEQAVQLAQTYGIFAAVGVHPHEAHRFVNDRQLDAAVPAQLETLLQEERVVAMGEIGLDSFKNYSPHEAQLIAFQEQLALAQRLKKPVVIHNREARGDLLKILKDANVAGVVHSFTGDGALAQEILSLGFYIGINGIITFPKSQALREAVKEIPLERLLLETDAPYLAPIPQRGRRNEPLYVRHVAECVAQIRSLPLEKLAEVTTKNAQRLFQLSLPRSFSSKSETFKEGFFIGKALDS